MLSEKNQRERDRQNSLTHLWYIRKIKDSMVIISRDNRDEVQEEQSMIGFLPQIVVGCGWRRNHYVIVVELELLTLDKNEVLK